VFDEAGSRGIGEVVAAFFLSNWKKIDEHRYYRFLELREMSVRIPSEIYLTIRPKFIKINKFEKIL
jgi:hypothetical protein